MYEVGDTVWLKSGSPPLTVLAVAVEGWAIHLLVRIPGGETVYWTAAMVVSYDPATEHAP